MQPGLWIGAAGCVAVATASGVAEWLRHRRVNLDRVGLMPWATLQFAAILGALILAGLALRLQ